MRETAIAYEGRATTDGRLIELGALYWEELPLPVFGFDNPELIGFRQVVGKIIDLKRQGNVLLATLDIDLPAGYCLSLDSDGADYVFNKESGIMSATKMRVCAGTLIPIEAWAWNEWL